ncbi:MAG TPA: hypothetical protein DIW61_03315 [Candidatus Aminicenantes bacterium]|nr:hypothetical protein [Candidatus Aminicenantes bacterium]
MYRASSSTHFLYWAGISAGFSFLEGGFCWTPAAGRQTTSATTAMKILRALGHAPVIAIPRSLPE